EAALAAIEQAVEIRRELAASRPDAFRPVLATSLNNLSGRLSNLGRREDAMAAAKEALEILTPYFIAQPDAFRERMRTLAGTYRGVLGQAGREADPDLDPILRCLEADS